MHSPHMLAHAAVALAFAVQSGFAKEPYEEPYWETQNPARIFDWETLSLLLSKRAPVVKIEAKSPEALVAQLEAIFDGVEGAEAIRFTFKRQLWEKPLSDGTIGKIEVDVRLDVADRDLLTVIRYVSELSLMTFSVKKGEIVFRPLIG